MFFEPKFNLINELTGLVLGLQLKVAGVTIMYLGNYHTYVFYKWKEYLLVLFLLLL